jgi:hypothetical protein
MPRQIMQLMLELEAYKLRTSWHKIIIKTYEAKLKRDNLAKAGEIYDRGELTVTIFKIRLVNPLQKYVRVP